MMFSSNLFIYSLLGSAAATHIGWSNGPKATKMTDPDVTTNCDYWANDVKPSDTCEALENYFGITKSQLVTWDPELQYDYCVLVPGFSYCVSGPAVTANSASMAATSAGMFSYSGTAAPTQSGLTPSCTKYHLVKNGDSCYNIQNQYMGFTLGQFYAWNPSIRTGCKGLVEGDFVCVAAKSSPSSSSSSLAFPTQTGVTSKCNKWHYVTNNDDCNSICDEYGLTPAHFYRWNPATGSQCANLWRHDYVCVGVPGSSSAPNTTTPKASATTSRKFTTTGTATATTATPSVPSPIQSGISSDCSEYYKVKYGDSCWSIEQDRNISTTDFNKWNPTMGSDCAALLKDYYVCVGT